MRHDLNGGAFLAQAAPLRLVRASSPFSKSPLTDHSATGRIGSAACTPPMSATANNATRRVRAKSMRYDNAKPTQEDAMIATIVQFALPAPISLAEATRRFESSAPKYQNLAGLVRKYYIRSEDGCSAGGIYLWESRAAAEAVYTGEWRERVEKLYGSKPTIAWFDTPIVVDNSGAITKAA